MATSMSSIVLDWMKEQPSGTTFTTYELMEILPVTYGAVSGFAAKLVAEGHLRSIKVKGNCLRYVIVDLEGVKIKRTSTRGGAIGRTMKQHSEPLPPITYKSICERLLEIAGDVERMRSPLSEYSTDDLLSELLRRQRNAS